MSSANAVARTITSSASRTPAVGSSCSRRTSGITPTRKRNGLRGQPWYTPSRCWIGGVAPRCRVHDSVVRTMYSALLRRRASSRAIAAMKLCSLHPFIARKPFCAGVCLSLASSHADSRRASMLAYSLYSVGWRHSGLQLDGTVREPFLWTSLTTPTFQVAGIRR
ncbi:Hypothetical protein PHPALM_5332 [Phytophthora palmivora]|uniref:Uncharacterized protein n=1 Tax=Phytophthora palmivora TaxID=4796 RepID=A0A2P4YHM9_9STRA|nr:Hypothetical protein PHPALM_5332 [Phytophthora palmivora]